MISLKNAVDIATRPLTILMVVGLIAGLVFGYQVLGPMLFG